MGKPNPETVETRKFRARIDAEGGHSVKLSDSFTRGVPDSYVVYGRLRLVEYKVGARHYAVGEVARWSTVGLSGMQDERIRRVCTIDRFGACLATVLGGVPTLWLPFDDVQYHVVAHGWEDVLRWMREALW